MPWARTSRHARGYGAAWDRLRLQVLERDRYLCQCERCKAEDRLTLATEVDHIRPRSQGGTDSLENLQAIGRECHRIKTQAESGKPMRARLALGADGWPMEPRRSRTG